MSTLYERAGGRQWFVDLVDRFYEAVAGDPVLRTLYPRDLKPSKSHLAGFLIQYWGGPAEYQAERGHPRLRMRHSGFSIGWAERDAWYGHMEAAVKAGRLSPEDEAEMLGYFNTSATFLINRPEEPAEAG